MKKRMRTKTKTFTTSYYYYYSQNINYHEKKLYNYLNVREKNLYLFWHIHLKYVWPETNKLKKNIVDDWWTNIRWIIIISNLNRQIQIISKNKNAHKSKI